MKRITKIFTSLVMIFTCLGFYIQQVGAVTQNTISPDTVLAKNKMVIYKGDEGDDIAKAINLQKVKVTTNAKVTEALTKDKVKAGSGFLKSYSIEKLREGIDFSFINATSYSLVEFNSTTEATVNYPLVGTYNGKKIGCNIKVDNIVNKVTTPKTGINYDYSAFIFTNNLYNGFINTNTSKVDLEYNFYYVDNNESIKTDGYFLNINSINGIDETVVEGTGEWVRCDNASEIYLTKDTNLTSTKVGDGYEVKGVSNVFNDYLGGKTFNKNSVTFKIEKPTFKISIGNDITSKNGNQMNAIWATVVSGVLTFNKPEDPIKSVDTTEVYQGDKFNYTIDQTINKLGVNASTSHYSSFIFKDTLPDKVLFNSLKVIDKSSNTDLTSKGTLELNNNELIFSFNKEYLEEMELNG